MATANSFPVTPGVAGAEPEIAGIQTTEGLQQVVRDPYATGVTDPVTWAASTTATHPTGFSSADLARLAYTMVSLCTGRVYLCFSTTSPTSLLHHWYIDPSERLTIAMPWAPRPLKLVADAGVTGNILLGPGTDT